MFRGIYTAASGMTATSRKQEMLTNNLANVETAGFKQDQSSLRAFPDILMYRMNDNYGSQVKGQPQLKGQAPLGVLHTGVYLQEGALNFQQGDVQETHRDLDFALVDQHMPVNPETEARGHLFFAVEIPEEASTENDTDEDLDIEEPGNEEEMLENEAEQTFENIRFTRNGQFTIDAEGYLATEEGYRVLDDLGDPIYAPDGARVAENGQLYVQEDGEEVPHLARLFLAYTEEPQSMVKEGHGLLRFDGEDENISELADVDFLIDLEEGSATRPFSVLQGYVERSNVDPTQTMTDMLNTYRMYEANQRILQAYDRSAEKAVNEVGRIY
ncbi:flagellar hook-basal body protein [Caldalkalibacillus salinus]|uniref:flagellar hook-basal body protein n=1 Tax=Caldalkalibacillus salinus TaxID=2803787 RepID=UPI0019206A3E|nr:flagellar hook-basal body protein [Caldalkalibacillus salinus]